MYNEYKRKCNGFILFSDLWRKFSIQIDKKNTVRKKSDFNKQIVIGIALFRTQALLAGLSKRKN